MAKRAAPAIAALLRAGALRCCDMHNRNCEPPSELCCRDCAEADHTHPAGRGVTGGHQDGTACVLDPWRRHDVVADDSGNQFCYHPLHGWFGLVSNQPSARGHQEFPLAEPVRLVARNQQPATPADRRALQDFFAATQGSSEGIE